MSAVELLAALERLEKAATPGPWLRAPQNYPGICAKRRGRNETAPLFKEEGYHGDEREPSIALTITLRNNLPAILSALRGVEAARERDEKLAQAYQVVGALAHETGTFDDPAVQRALDYLSGDAFQEDFLPWALEPLRRSLITVTIEALRAGKPFDGAPLADLLQRMERKIAALSQEEKVTP